MPSSSVYVKASAEFLKLIMNRHRGCFSCTLLGGVPSEQPQDSASRIRRRISEHLSHFGVCPSSPPWSPQLLLTHHFTKPRPHRTFFQLAKLIERPGMIHWIPQIEALHTVLYTVQYSCILRSLVHCPIQTHSIKKDVSNQASLTIHVIDLKKILTGKHLR